MRRTVHLRSRKRNDAEWDELSQHFTIYRGTRQFVVADIDMVEEPRMVLVDIAADIVAVVVVVADVEDTCPAADKEDWHAVVGMGSYC